VYSFYKYSEIESLLLTKHTDIGYYIYTILAKNAFKRFRERFTFENKVAAVGIDDHARHGYSHTALLVRQLKSDVIQPYYGRLRAQSQQSYSAQTFEYRLMHPRNFLFKSFVQTEVILVDDILTTGLTLSQAVETLQAHGKEVLFCLTLADADNK